MSRTIQRNLLAAALILAPVPCFAGAADVVACRAIKNDTERLACFDRTAGDLAADVEAAKKSPFDLFGLFSSKPQSEKEFGGPAPAPAKQAVEGREEVPPVTSVSAKISGLSFTDGKPVFYLDNGQVWTAQEARRVTLKGDGTDQATVKRGLMGYFITVNGSSADISVRRIR